MELFMCVKHQFEQICFLITKAGRALPERAAAVINAGEGMRPDIVTYPYLRPLTKDSATNTAAILAKTSRELESTTLLF